MVLQRTLRCDSVADCWELLLLNYSSYLECNLRLILPKSHPPCFLSPSTAERKRAVFHWAVLCILRLVVARLLSYLQITSVQHRPNHIYCVLSAYQCGKEKDTLSNSIDCSQLNWDRGLSILCGCGLFGQNKILFFAGQSFALQDLLLLVYSSYLQIHLCPPPPELPPPYLFCTSMWEKKRAGDTLSDSTLLEKWILFIA